jgi:hypothetical protein
MMTEGYFKEQLQRIDSLCEVDFEVVQYGIHVRPSHPRYRKALIERALEMRPAGAVLYVVREVDEFINDPVLYETKRRGWLHRLLGKLRPEHYD